jgi:diguanylate cyclase (GGDEF)-like protein/PAS domain S-box-containing protein
LTHSATQSLRRALARADNQIAVRKHIEAELERRSHELLLLNRASHTLVSSLDLDQILANLLQQVDSLFSAVGAFWLLESDSNSLVCRQASGPASDQVRGWRLRLGEGLVGWVAQTGESVIVPDAMTDQRHFKGVEQKTGMTARSILCVPLTTQNRVIGVLQVMDTTQPQRFNTTHLPLAEFLAATAAIAIENARLYAASQQTAERLRESEVRYRTLFENLPIPVFTKDLAGRYTSSNRENSKYWMVNPLGHTDAELLPPQIAEQFRAHDQRVITEGVSHLAEEYIDTPLGKRALLTLKSPLRDSAGNIAGILGASMDITDRKRLEQELERQRDFALRVMNTMGQGLTITNSEGRFEFVNAAYAEMMGYTPEELLGKQPRDITYPPDIPTLERARQERRQGRITSYESRLVRKDGSVIPVLITGVPRADSGEYAGAIAVITDLTTQKQIEEQLRYLGTHDALTGIFNRAFFETELARLEHSREFPISIIVADLDDMKWTNDTRGHAAGDELLKATARILQSSFRASDILARIGGDEFAVLLPSTNAVIAARILNRVREKITEHNTAQPAWVIQLSLGVATATAATKLSETFKQADARMYEDKRVRKL